MDFETPEADAADQALVVVEDPSEDFDENLLEAEHEAVADPADIADQHHLVPDQEEDERG